MHQDTIDTGSQASERPEGRRGGSDAAAQGDAALSPRDRERARLAFDIHDGPAQAVSAALLQARILESASGPDLHDGLAELARILTAALEDLYALIEQLRTSAVEDEALVDRVAAEVSGFADRSGVRTTFTVDGDGDGYTPSMKIAVFRIVQEALNNVRQHAEASSVSVDLELGDEVVTCSIEDDGRGFDPEAVGRGAGQRDGYGLDGMRERAAILGGRCDITTDPDRGTRVVVSLPVWKGE
jgi:two-component system, NarL family, sensor histidine kinase DegS